MSESWRQAASNVVVDAAGASMGGAQRFYGELLAWQARHPQAVTLVGERKRLNARWLVQREFAARRQGASRVVALNNVSFAAAHAERLVLVRNALYFLDRGEEHVVFGELRRRLGLQRTIATRSLRRAHMIVVPSSAMRERVVRNSPEVADRVRVRFHPVSPVSRQPGDRPTVVCPVLDAPYKHMGDHLRLLVSALDHAALPDVRAVVTMTSEEVAAYGLRVPPSIELVGRLATTEVSNLLSTATAVYFPTTIESFGYPLAEARASGIPVLAPRTLLATEIAGPALVPFEPGDPVSLAAAVAECMNRSVVADPHPFDPSDYFFDLFGVPRG